MRGEGCKYELRRLLILHQLKEASSSGSSYISAQKVEALRTTVAGHRCFRGYEKKCLALLFG
jgi:hypothetical protein